VRAFAAYFSDLLLWISIAGALEMIAVMGMALLCILSAGYFFDHMKKNPVVLVLGGIVALAGTFLMFREVRAMIFSPPAVVAPQTQAPPSTPPDAGPPPADLSKEIGKPFDLTCTGLPQFACQINLKCTWSAGTKMCLARPPAEPTPGWNFPSSSYELTTCVLLPESTCKETSKCYWSPLFNRCERLLVGTGLGRANTNLLGCNGLEESACKAQSDCLWILNGCMKDLLKTPAGP
jgi:hypothetical protein